MKIRLLLLVLFAGLLSEAAEQQSEFMAGRASYAAGDFKNAARHFQRAVDADPHDAESYYRAGMTYEVLADIATPFGARYNAKARRCLTQAVQLAPDRQDYRRSLFDFLLGSGNPSRSALRQANAILATAPESDDDANEMRRLLADERRINSGAEARLGRVFLAVPRVTARLAGQ
jgi:tetratricopeptide (TPR) repeat protein